MNTASGGVTAALGFTAGGIHCGVKKRIPGGKEDLALIYSELPCTAAAVFTRNRVQAAPIAVTRAHVAAGEVRAVVVNSGNANACCPNDRENALEMCRLAAGVLGLRPEQVAVASTGVIGQTLNIAAIEERIGQAALSRAGHSAAMRAIMTTDTTEKEAVRTVELGGKLVTIGAMAKGSGMIHPNMGTMLCFVTTDCAISAEMLRAALEETVPRTFNRVTVDGDTSTNDTCLILANGMAENRAITTAGEDYAAFAAALGEVCRELAIAIAADGEGASKLMTCHVRGASCETEAETLAKSVVGSPLVKAAMTGADANWGRVLCALGYAGAEFSPERVGISFGSAAGEVEVCRDGRGLPFDETLARTILEQDAVRIAVTLREGQGEAECWGCNLTSDYVKINGEYRT